VGEARVIRACEKSRRVARAAVIAATLAAGVSLAAPQLPNSSGPYLSGNTQEMGHGHGQEEEPFATREMQERQMKRLREEHQKQVYSDTAELLRLVNNLKAEVGKSDTPSPDALRDIDEIGRLAKRVSERIKTQ
jgi:Spy/CpxP family protein refolding chaperone